MHFSAFISAIAALSAPSVLAAPVADTETPNSLLTRSDNAAASTNNMEYDPIYSYCYSNYNTAYCRRHGYGRQDWWRQYTYTGYINGRQWTWDARTGQYTPTILDGQFDPDACTPGLLCSSGPGGRKEE
ncbi:hypothetical protein HII31_06530 [Pseudocercospora fuligena]|uniref:Uncharacterized protein n=1 Tax=Pseudocercospora fuligena TaxID=685502 RepID=A0A8H6RIJ8_9PEZI|nr:hypothetical protein HII31_06530 [Pseudocercospora fuligena]